MGSSNVASQQVQFESWMNHEAFLFGCFPTYSPGELLKISSLKNRWVYEYKMSRYMCHSLSET